MSKKQIQSDQSDESVTSKLSETDPFRQRIEGTFGKMTKEEIIEHLLDIGAGLDKTIKKWEAKGMASKGKDKKEWLAGADRFRSERWLISHLGFKAKD